MQRARICCEHRFRCALQYPRSGRYRCNTFPDMFLCRAIKSLQYPRSGRYRCNLLCRDRFTAGQNILAVPSFGPLSMQPCAAMPRRRRRTPCSTLVRAVIDATLQSHALPPPARACSTLVRAVIDATCNALLHQMKQPGLAVPSFGPLSMQPRLSARWSLPRRALQYPRSGRYRCNCADVGMAEQVRTCSTLVRAVIDATLSPGRYGVQGHYLAVPSFGPLSMQRNSYAGDSNAPALAVPSFGPLSMQLCIRKIDAYCCIACSTLVRAVIDATCSV